MRPSGGSLQKPQRRPGASTHSSSTGGPGRSSHLYRVPGLLSAGDFGMASAGPGSGTERASRAGEVCGVDVRIPTSDGREVLLTRYTQPEPELQLLLSKLKLQLPAQPPPKISSQDHGHQLMRLQCRPLASLR